MATEFVGGSSSSQGLGEVDLDAGGGTVIKGNDADPNTDPAINNAPRGFKPWVDQADFDHRGFGTVTATTQGLTCDMERLTTIKKRITATLSGSAWRYEVKRGHPSTKGQKGPTS